MLSWVVLSFMFTVALIIIGLRRWEGWMVASITNIGWLVHTMVNGNGILEAIVNVISLVITVIFWVRWNKDQRVKDRDEIVGSRT